MSPSKITIYALILIVFIGIVLALRHPMATVDTTLDPKLGKPPIPEEIAANLKTWVWITNSLRILQVLLGVVGTAAALTATTFTTDLPHPWTKVCMAVAAFCIGILTAFDIGGKADKTRQAWRQLTGAIMLYRYDDTFTLPKLVEAYEKAEDLVGGVTFRDSTATKPKDTPPNATPH